MREAQLKNKAHLDVLDASGAAERSRSVVRSLLSKPAFLLTIDLFLGLVAFFMAWLIRTSFQLPYTQDLLPQERWEIVRHPWVLLLSTQAFVIYLFGLYDDLRITRYREIVAFLFLACALQVISVTSWFYFTNAIYPRSVILLFDVGNFFILCCWRLWVKSELKKGFLRVLIIGQDSRATQEIINDVEKSPWMGLHIVGLALGKTNGEEDLGYPVLGTLDEVHRLVGRYRIEEIILASEPSWKDRVLDSLSKLQYESAVRVAILPSVFDMAIGKLRHVNIHDTPLIQVRRNPNEPFERFIKRVFDLSFSTVSLLLLAPLLLLVALLIKLTSRGSVFYLQERVGRGGKVFRLIKFRTMIRDAERLCGEILASQADPRVTRFGRILRRLRVDELPQLLNVVAGSMSFVGPRPERPKFVRDYEQQVIGYSERHRVKPGITGLAQVRGYYHTAVENKLKYDLAYIYNYSFSLDLLILLETLKTVLIRKGS